MKSSAGTAVVDAGMTTGGALPEAHAIILLSNSRIFRSRLRTVSIRGNQPKTAEAPKP